MKKTKIVVPALAVLLLSTAASVTGTVAWFSMNNSVTVTGMTVTTKVSSNLQIAETNLEANYGDSLEQARSGILEPASSVDGAAFFYTTNASGNGVAKENGNTTFKTYSEADVTNADNPATTEVENNYHNILGATDGEGAANASDKTKTGKTNYDINFNSAYGFNAYDATANSGKGNGNVSFAYIDYSFYVKGTYADASHKIVLTKCNLAYKNESGDNYGSITTAWAWRVGMFVTTAAENTNITDASAAVAGNLVTILDFAASKNQNEIEAVQLAVNDNVADASLLFSKPNLTGEHPAVSEGKSTVAGTYYRAKAGEAGPKAVNGNANTSYALVGGEGNAKANANAIVDNSPTALATQRYKVVIRLWLEGEDVSCTSSTYANLTRDWRLDLEFRQGSAETPVNVISTNAVTVE